MRWYLHTFRPICTLVTNRLGIPARPGVWGEHETHVASGNSYALAMTKEAHGLDVCIITKFGQHAGLLDDGDNRGPGTKSYER